MTAIWRISSEVTTDSTVLPDNTTRQVYIALNADHFPIAFKLKTGREPKSEKPAQLRSRTTQSAHHKYGFHLGRSTITSLCEMTTRIPGRLNSRNPHKLSIILVLYLSKAFDTVSHNTLLRDVVETTLPNVIKVTDHPKAKSQSILSRVIFIL